MPVGPEDFASHPHSSIEVKVPIIKNYGFLWERKYIYRGSGGDGNAGHLRGKVKNSQEADFRDQIGVYVLYDRNQHIVYVGQAGNGNASLFTRLKNHMDGDLWNRWEYFTWIGFRDVNVNGRLSDVQCVDSNVSVGAGGRPLHYKILRICYATTGTN